MKIRKEFKMLNYANELVEFEGCPGCAYHHHEFTLPCGMAYENELINMSQDWELPIPGFFVITPNRHVEVFSELTEEERNEIFKIVATTIQVMRENHICESYNVIFEEKEKRHFHVWLMPRYQWMVDLVGNITANIGTIFAYAKENMRTSECFQKIDEATLILKRHLNGENYK